MDEIIEEVVEEVAEVEEEVKEEEEVEGEVKEEEEKPIWQSESDESDKMPVASHLKTKRKLQGKLDARDARVEQLEKENETLKHTTPIPSETLKRPRANDFDTDDEYEEAMDKYEDDRFNGISKNLSQVNTQKSQQDRQLQIIGSDVNDHYTRAEELVKSTGIELDVYKTADSNVRQAVEDVLPNQGNQSVDYLIHVLGDESEKVLFYLGRNKAKLAEFQSLLVADPNGLKAATFLGELKQTIKSNTKKSSRAPKPAVNVTGDVVPKSKGSAEKRKFEKAQEKGEDQQAYNIKKAAKAAGHDVGEW